AALSQIANRRVIPCFFSTTLYRKGMVVGQTRLVNRLNPIRILAIIMVIVYIPRIVLKFFTGQRIQRLASAVHIHFRNQRRVLVAAEQRNSTWHSGKRSAEGISHPRL